MAWFLMKRKRRGMSMVEVMAVVGVIAILLAMGFMVLRSMRLAARVAVAETRLKQVATGLELYFKEYGTYPPQGSDLVAELAPFVENPTVFNNPLLEEETPGETINVLYHQPTVDEIDSPDNYVTAMMADNGRTLVVLKTGNKVVRRDDLRFSPDDPSVIVDVLDPTPPPPEPPADDGEGDGEEPDGGFDVDDDGDVTTRMCSDVTIDCIGSQFGYADGTFVDIVVEANLENGWMSLYNGQPVHGGESFSQQSVPAGTNVVVKGEIAGAYERWLWSYYGYPLSYTSNGSCGQVLTLVTGDTPVCFEPGFPCQAAVGDLLEPYVDPQTHVVVIEDNEALYLWDFNPLYTNYGIDYQDLIILATAVATEQSECEDAEPESEPDPQPSGVTVAGAININPNNRDNFEFELEKPDGSTITRDDLHGSRATLTYEGPAVSVRVRPKGNGNQNGLTVDGQGVRLRNGTTYTITSENMTVNLYNTKPGRMKYGNAMGKWWIEVSAYNATIDPDPSD